MNLDDLQGFVPDTSLFGTDLATAVATKLKSGVSVGFSHRDYCGMGISFQEGKYYYGEIWDSQLEPTLFFEGETVFVDWLAVQSTASLARLDDKEFFQGNQIITKQRLEAFLQGASSILEYLPIYFKS